MDKCFATSAGWAEKYQNVFSPYHNPHFLGTRGIIVQLMEWPFLDIAEECRTLLGPRGYGGVQLSPVLEHVVLNTSVYSHPWWERYELLSYYIGSRSGTESDFWTMSRICNDAGVRLYADVNLNHMASLSTAYYSNVSTNGVVLSSLNRIVNITDYHYPGVPFTKSDFHKFCIINNSVHAHEIRNCQKNGHPDLNHAQSGVKEKMVLMLNQFLKMGVAGFRIDAAKHVWPKDMKHIFDSLDNLNVDFNFSIGSRPFFYHDVVDMGSDSISKTEYTPIGVVTEYLYAVKLANIINAKSAPLTSLINWGPAMGFLSHQNALVFVDSHDTQRGLVSELSRNRVLTHKERTKYVIANVFMLAHPFGRLKRIMSSYHYLDGDVNRGAPRVNTTDGIRGPEFDANYQCRRVSGWVCEHRWPVMLNMVAFANYFNGRNLRETSVMYFQTNGPNQIAFCRGHAAFVAINNDSERIFSKKLYTSLPPGTYCDIITGGLAPSSDGCLGRHLLVNEESYAQLQLPVASHVKFKYAQRIPNLNYGVLIVYVKSKLREIH
ncbi:alpha-amylase 1-like [Glossina fuscipes]|uniref:Alpha-amylase n=1 Tax=Glossina fuscipes TaxID=7396 RepID=A0A9C5ZI87_9MUSC|nr:alpha-amylase 1-like [Glossina fuscipes]